MKNRIIGSFILAFAMIGMYMISEEIFNEEIVVQVPQTLATSTEPILPGDWIKEAEKAYEDVIRIKTLEKEKNLLESILASTTGRIDEIDKELGKY